MFNSNTLQTHLESSSTVEQQAFVTAEWNMNDPDNIFKVGNYRRRFTAPRNRLISVFDRYDGGNWYTGATDADVEVAGPYDDYDEPTVFLQDDIKRKLIYSLDDCLLPHRPRSGINYPMWFRGKYVGGTRVSARRPRYYMASYDNDFRYWSSFRREGGVERGVSQESPTGEYYIEDAVPFVVYKESVPANRLVIKMQTNTGTENWGSKNSINGPMDDPFYGEANATVPRRWAVQVLKGTDWTNAVSFEQNETRTDGSPIVGPDGYVELAYGVLIPKAYGRVRYMDTLTSASFLPDGTSISQGDYYYVVANEDYRGTIYLWNEGDWTVITSPRFGWQLVEDYDDIDRNLLTDLINPATFNQGGEQEYKEFEYIDGIRIVVYTMNTLDTPFDLIEMSPRLLVNLTDRTLSYNQSSSIGKVDETALPLGSLQAASGSIDIFNYDGAFSLENEESVLFGKLDSGVTFSFYDVIKNIGNTDFYVPLKKMYSEGKEPEFKDEAVVSYNLRDGYFMFENQPAPAIMITDVSLSRAVCVLLDAVGFSNYDFRRVSDQKEPIIPFFYVGPDQNVAEVLQKLAVATQSAMFFDEYNNFIVMYKEYMLPSSDSVRGVDLVLDGDSSIPNIEQLSSTEKKIVNAGTISYTERYIQRSVGSLTQANFVNEDQTYVYLPALLWEVTGTEATRTINDKASTQSNYSLGAMPLSADLSATLPHVSSRKLVNNTIDLGENVYWLPRYEGYLYSAGEIIKFDAVQYQVQGAGVKWISSNEEYQKYFAELPFNGKMFPTGIVRIYTEPYYESIDGVEYMKNGPVARHGRGQFGTEVTTHTAGLSSFWTDDDNVKACRMQSECLFDSIAPPATELGEAGISSIGANSSRTGIIKNHFRNVSYTEAQLKNFLTPRAGTVQSSALVFSGPNIKIDAKPRDTISYVHKPLNGVYKHFGTRMRIIGKVEAAANIDQSPSGAMTYYNTVLNNEAMVLVGGSGGIGIGISPTTNMGYYFEVIAMTNTNLTSISGSDDGTGVHNIVFYKVAKEQGSTSTDRAVPIKLWGGLADIVVDSGTFTGQSRATAEDVTTVYDLSVEYQDIGRTRRFFLYVNGQQVATVDDTVPLPMYGNMCLFVRGTSKVMFENIFALANNPAYTSSNAVVSAGVVADAFGENRYDTDYFRRFGISGFVQKTYLSGVASGSPPRYNMYYDEFGSIMRECAYFDIKYDKAYPALYAQISPNFNNTPVYTVSGFKAGSYGAKFLVFNVADKSVNLDDTSGNYLRIQGITFTQNTNHEFTMDDYYGQVGNLADPQITATDSIFRPPRTAQESYKNLKISRMKFGKNEFSLQTEYIQSQAAATNLMSWLSNKITRPRKLVGFEIFNNPLVQLGDIVSIEYTYDGVDKVATPSKRFVVYNIERTRSSEEYSTKIFVSEV